MDWVKREGEGMDGLKREGMDGKAESLDWGIKAGEYGLDKRE